MPNHQQLFYTKMDALANAINTKAGTTGAKDLDALKTAVDSINANPPQVSDVNFYNYDGSLVASYTRSAFLALTELPANASSEGLTSQEWNYTLANAKTHVTNYTKLDIGQMYITDDGKTRLYITIPNLSRCAVPLYWNQTVTDGVTIDWGDNTASETAVGTGNKTLTHSYAAAGSYVITLNPATGCTLRLGWGAPGQGVLGGSNANHVYANMLQRVEIGRSVTQIDAYAFAGCSSLQYITIPRTITSVGQYAFQECYSLQSITIPSSVTSIGIYAFQSCGALVQVNIPRGVTSLSSHIFQYCYALTHLILPIGLTSIGELAFQQCAALSSIIMSTSVTSIGASAFDSCPSFATIKIPSGVATINAYVFQNCYGMAKYDFTAYSSVPTLVNTNAFMSMPNDCWIVVPASKLSAWQSASNWSTYATQIIAG